MDVFPPLPTDLPLAERLLSALRHAAPLGVSTKQLPAVLGASEPAIRSAISRLNTRGHGIVPLGKNIFVLTKHGAPLVSSNGYFVARSTIE